MSPLFKRTIFGYSVIVVLAITFLYPSRYIRGGDMYWIFAACVAAKILGTFDKLILGLAHVLSGHALKHVAAAIAAVVVLRMLSLRRVQALGFADSKAYEY